MKKTVRVYETLYGKKPFKEWRESLRDVRASVAVGRRIVRIEEGNFGDHKHLHSGFTNYGSTSGQGFGSITVSTEIRWCSCFMEAIKGLKSPISNEQ